MRLTGKGSLALGAAVAASVASGATRRLVFWWSGNLAQILVALGAALQRGGAVPSFELEIGGGVNIRAEEEQAAYAPLAALLGRISLLSIHLQGELRVRSPVLRRLEVHIEGREARQLRLQFDVASALESVLFERVFPSEAAPLLAALASDPNLPALMMVRYGAAALLKELSKRPAAALALQAAGAIKALDDLVAASVAVCPRCRRLQEFDVVGAPKRVVPRIADGRRAAGPRGRPGCGVDGVL